MTLAARLLPRLVLGGLLTVGLLACSPAAPTASPAAITPVPTDTPAATVSPAPTPVPTATAAPTAAPGTTACGIADLKASRGLVSGAAGSIITEVVLESDADCTVESSPSLGLQDKSGTTLITATPAGPGSIEIVPGDAYTSQIRIANWCDSEPAFPLALILWIDDEKLVVTGGSFPDGGMPGCLGTGGVRLESTPWVVSP